MFWQYAGTPFCDHYRFANTPFCDHYRFTVLPFCDHLLKGNGKLLRPFAVLQYCFFLQRPAHRRDHPSRSPIAHQDLGRDRLQNKKKCWNKKLVSRSYVGIELVVVCVLNAHRIFSLAFLFIKLLNVSAQTV